MKNALNLNGSWNLYYYNENDDKIKITHPAQLNDFKIYKISATVPGNVELDLSDAGVLPKDLFKGNNFLKAEKY